MVNEVSLILFLLSDSNYYTNNHPLPGLWGFHILYKIVIVWANCSSFCPDKRILCTDPYATKGHEELYCATHSCSSNSHKYYFRYINFYHKIIITSSILPYSLYVKFTLISFFFFFCVLLIAIFRFESWLSYKFWYKWCLCSYRLPRISTSSLDTLL